jgi:hypothetical protein
MSHQSYIKIRRQSDQRFFVGPYSLQVELILRLGTVVLNLILVDYTDSGRIVRALTVLPFSDIPGTVAVA